MKFYVKTANSNFADLRLNHNFQAEGFEVGSSKLVYEDADIAFGLLGEIFRLAELGQSLGLPPATPDEIVLASFLKQKSFNPVTLNGSYILCVYRKSDRMFEVFSDPLGSFYAYYHRRQDEVLICTHLNDFSPQRGFKLNPEWTQNYFRGIDDLRFQTALSQVYRLNGGEKIVFGKNLWRLEKYFDFRDFYNTERAKPKIASSTEEATDFFTDLTTKNLKDIYRQFKKPTLFLSSGIDSTSLYALLAKAKLPIFSMTRIPDNRYRQDCNRIHARQMELYPHDNQKHYIEASEVFNGLTPEYYLQPDNNVWQTLGINHQKSVVPTQKAGGDCVISASLGDFLFMHRTRYLFARWADQREPKILDFQQAKESFFDGDPELKTEYAYNPGEINPSYFRKLMKCDFSFDQYFLETFHLLTGVSYDRDNRLAGKISVLDPFQDLELFRFFYRLDEESISLSMRKSIFQEKMIVRAFGERVYLPKYTNPFAEGLVAYPYFGNLSLAIEGGLRLLAELEIPTLANYQQKYTQAQQDSKMDLELVRVLTFFWWHQNWANERSP